MNTEDKILKLIKKANPANPLVYVQELVKPLMQDKINSIIENCNSCKNVCHNKKTYTAGNIKANVLVIGETSLYDSHPSTFSKQEEAIIDKIFDTLKINKNQFFFVNAVSCSNHKNLPPSMEQVTNCKVFADTVIEMMRPALIILMGNVPTRMYTGKGIMEVHGKIIKINNIPAIPVYSPQFLLDMKELKEKEIMKEYNLEFVSELKNALRAVQGKYNINIFLEGE